MLLLVMMGMAVMLVVVMVRVMMVVVVMMVPISAYLIGLLCRLNEITQADIAHGACSVISALFMLAQLGSLCLDLQSGFQCIGVFI